MARAVNSRQRTLQLVKTVRSGGLLTFQLSEWDKRRLLPPVSVFVAIGDFGRCYSAGLRRLSCERY
jgi:hypothetical protein